MKLENTARKFRISYQDLCPVGGVRGQRHMTDVVLLAERHHLNAAEVGSVVVPKHHFWTGGREKQPRHCATLETLRLWYNGNYDSSS